MAPKGGTRSGPTGLVRDHRAPTPAARQRRPVPGTRRRGCRGGGRSRAVRTAGSRWRWPRRRGGTARHHAPAPPRRPPAPAGPPSPTPIRRVCVQTALISPHPSGRIRSPACHQLPVAPDTQVGAERDRPGQERARSGPGDEVEHPATSDGPRPRPPRRAPRRGWPHPSARPGSRSSAPTWRGLGRAVRDHHRSARSNERRKVLPRAGRPIAHGGER